MIFISSLIPDIDSEFSFLGKKKIFRPLQWIVKHRGIVHSFIFLFPITFILTLLLPITALPFFLGYSIHLIADSFTIEGVRFFYPFKKEISWKIRTGGKVEMIVQAIFVIADLFLLYNLVL